jgi:NAD(P)-dependent dehydrogenase (short-subunit alcohol dehydrogenase family)
MRAKGAGVIVNVSSSVTLKPLSLLPVYTASKAAVNAFTGCLALELAPLGIRTRLVLPGQAPATRFGSNAMALMQGASEAPEEYKPIIEQAMSALRENAAKEPTRPEDVVQAIWRAVTDPDCPLRLPAGSDAVALAA